jgi:hypothetical protein
MKNMWASFQRIIELFTHKIVTMLSKIWVWDPRSGMRKKPTGYSGSRIQGQKDTGSRIRIRNTAQVGTVSEVGLLGTARFQHRTVTYGTSLVLF